MQKLIFFINLIKKFYWNKSLKININPNQLIIFIHIIVVYVEVNLNFYYNIKFSIMLGYKLLIRKNAITKYGWRVKLPIKI